LGANALGGGLISYGPIGGGPPLGFNFSINGVLFPFPGTGNGNVVGPTSPPASPNDVVLWNGGTTVKDGGFAISLSVLGADPTGTNDSTAAIQSCLNGVGAGGACFVGKGKYKVLSNLTIPANTTLTCGMTFPSAEEIPTNVPNMPSILLAATASISAAGEGAAVKNCLVVRNGMTFPITDPSAYAGIALTDAGFADFTVTDTLVVGFDTCIYITGKRPTLVHDIVDCNGVSKAALELDTGNTDWGLVEDVHAQLLTNGNSCASIQRAGTGIRIAGPGPTGIYLNNVLAQNFKVAQFDFEQGTLGGGVLWSDDVAFNGVWNCGGTSIGYLIAPGAFIQTNVVYGNASHIGMQINSNGTNSRINYLSLNTQVQGGTGGGNCMVLGDGTHVGNIDVGTYVAGGCGLKAIHVSTPAGSLDIQNAIMGSDNGGVAPYIDGDVPVVLQINNLATFHIANLSTDLPAGTSPYQPFNAGTGLGAVSSFGSEPMLRGINVTVGGTCTGLGTGGSPGCAIAPHSDPSVGAITLTTGATGMANAGAAQIVSPLPPQNIAYCTANPGPGNANWPNQTAIQPGSTAGTFTFEWSTNTALAANSTYNIVYHCSAL
jgi:hypothetical protein